MSSVRAEEDKIIWKRDITKDTTRPTRRQRFRKVLFSKCMFFNHNKMPPAFSNLSTLMSDPAKCGRNLT